MAIYNDTRPSRHPGGYVVTGRDYHGRRFRKVYPGTIAGAFFALGINLWNGTVWGVDANGKREAIKRIRN